MAKACASHGSRKTGPCSSRGSPGTAAAASRAAGRPRCQHDGVPDLSRMRRDYTAGRLDEDDLAPTWVEQFDRWFGAAVAAELPEPNAVVVATADADGAPDARIVLMKGYDENGWARLPDGADASSVGTSLALLEALHDRWVRLLRTLTAEDFARTFRHPERGSMPLDLNLALYAWHGRHHAAHVTALREAKGW